MHSSAGTELSINLSQTSIIEAKTKNPLRVIKVRLKNK